MSKIFRALYTRCVNGTNFNSAPTFRGGQKLFSTSGDMGLSNDVLSFIEAEIGRDVYNAGLRPYNKEICRFFSYGGISVLIHYRWMSQEETGSREFGITKALIGNFTHHPIEYLSSEFFNGDDFFVDYPDADRKKITSYKQLLTFQGQIAPPLFKPIPESALFELKSFSEDIKMTFEDAGSYVLQPNAQKIAERVRAAVCHLVKQFALPENERQGIIIKGSPEQLRYWFAAIGYAFSARSAQNIAFNIGLPPTGYSYSFSTAALVGWDKSDPDLAKLGNTPPTNLVFLEQLEAADKDTYYDAIVKFNDVHSSFAEFVKHNKEMKNYPALFCEYNNFHNYCKELSLFANGDIKDFRLKEYIDKTARYLSSHYFLPGYYDAILAATNKKQPANYDDIDDLIEIYSLIEKIISNDLLGSSADVVEKANDDFDRLFVDRFYDVFTSILTDKYPYFNESSTSRKPQDFFGVIVKRKQDCAYEIAQRLTQEDAYDMYMFSFLAPSANFLLGKQQNTTEKGYLSNVIYPRLSFVAYMMKWCQKNMTESSANYVCKALNAVLIHYPNERNANASSNVDLQSNSLQVPLAERAAIYKNVFAPFREKSNPINVSGVRGLKIYWDCLYTPKNIDVQYYEDMLEKIFLYNWVEMLEQREMKNIAHRLADAQSAIMSLLDEGFSEHVLVSLYLENHDLENKLSVFYYMYSTKIFAPRVHTEILKNILTSTLDNTLRLRTYSPNDNVLLSKVSSILKILEKVDSKTWDACCAIVDDHLNKMFDMHDWERHTASSESQISILADYLYEKGLPVSVQVSLYHLLNNTGMKHPNTLLSNYYKYQNIFIKSSSSYKHSILRAIAQKQLTGTFYLELVALFSDDNFLAETLNVMADSKTIDGKLAFCDFVNEFMKAHQPHFEKDNNASAQKNIKIYRLLLDHVISRTLKMHRYSQIDDIYLSVVEPILIALKKIDEKTWDKCCKDVDNHLSKILNFDNMEMCIVSEKTQVCTLANYLVDMLHPVAIKICLYSTLYNWPPNESDPCVFIKGYLPYRKVFNKCSSAYKTSLLRAIEKKKWTGKFYLCLLELFFDDAIFLSKILKQVGTSETPKRESAFCDLCREFMKAYRNCDTQSQDNNVQILREIYEAIKKYYRSLLPSGWSLLSSSAVLKEFDKVAKIDSDLAEMKKLLDPPPIKNADWNDIESGKMDEGDKRTIKNARKDSK